MIIFKNPIWNIIGLKDKEYVYRNQEYVYRNQAHDSFSAKLFREKMLIPTIINNELSLFYEVIYSLLSLFFSLAGIFNLKWLLRQANKIKIN